MTIVLQYVFRNNENKEVHIENTICPIIYLFWIAKGEMHYKHS